MFKRQYAYLPGRIAPHLDPARKFPRKEELFNADGTPRYHTDWQDAASRLAISHEHALSFSLGKDDITALASLSYNDQQGILINSYSRQLNGFLSLGWDVKKWLHGYNSHRTHHRRQPGAGGGGGQRFYCRASFYTITYTGEWKTKD